MTRLLTTSALAGCAFALMAVPAFAVQSADAPDTAQYTDEDVVIVTGRARSLYRVGEISSGKLPVEPLLSTQTVQVINEQLIEDQGARDAQDLYRNFSGVSVFSYAGVTAGASLGAGIKANALLGGLDESIALNPLSVETQTGANLTLGVTSLVLEPAG